MTDLIPDLSDDEALAAEYVLGVLDLSARSQVEARVKVDAPFAALVAAWEQDLAGLNASYAEVAPPADLLPRVEARLFARAAKQARSFWPRFIGGVVTAGILAVVVLVASPPDSPPAPDLVASLTAEAQPLIFEAAFAAGTLRLSQKAGSTAEAGRVYEAWLIAGDAAPVSLGLIEGRAVELPLATLQPGNVLAVSLEPAGGSTTGAPTGPVLVTGVVGA